VPNSGLIAGVDSGAFSVHRQYEPSRDLLTLVSNAWNGTTLSTFAYANDALGRRTQRIDDVAVTNTFGYNPRSELVSAAMDTNSFTYGYDAIGNRTAVTNNAEVLTYLSNALNQYTNIANGVTNTPIYDADGNLLTRGDWGLDWDGENRLVAMTNGTSTLAFAYDYMGRRVTKVTDGFTHHFWYDGWNLAQEISSSGITTIYTWGSDLSGSLQGAGGIGGLLSVTLCGAGVSPATYFPCYDANGNVTELVATNGTLAAQYAYDPYGNILHQSGPLAAENPFRFSTKYTDQETGLVNFGFRLYQPPVGRWLSRDPIEEEGGLNLYGFLENDPANDVDMLGEHGTVAPEIARLRRTAIDWRVAGYDFAANVLTHFFTGRGPATYIGSPAEANKIKIDPKYRDAAQEHFDRLAHSYGGRTGRYRISRDARAKDFAFHVDYYSGDLFYALGGAHFGYRGILDICGSRNWIATVNMVQRDYYTFARRGFLWGRLWAPSYRAARHLEFPHGFHPFWNEEEWPDQLYSL